MIAIIAILIALLLPAGTFNSASAATGTCNNSSPIPLIMPFLEQGNAYALLNFNLDINGQASNLAARQQKMATIQTTRAMMAHLVVGMERDFVTSSMG